MSQAWEPRLPLTAAERVVDFPAHYDHVTSRRAAVENAAARAARQLGFVAADLGTVPWARLDKLARALERALDETMRFGFNQAQQEIKLLRDVPVAAYSIEDAGRYGRLAAFGKAGIRRLIAERAQQAAAAIGAAVVAAFSYDQQAEDLDALRVALAAVAGKVLHNHVLELVGETLNMGRTAGALALKQPPEYSLRSEQLDKRTCDPCSRLHGEITVVGSPEYFAALPPTGCLGGGRCRGIPIFGDTQMDVAQPEAA